MSNDPYAETNYNSTNNLSFNSPLNNRSGEKLSLNNEQIQSLLQQLSSDEQKDLTDRMRSCTSEVTMTRGLPITAAILGSLYISRQRLPPQYHFGPKGWPFYAIMGIASLTATNFMCMGKCRDQITPKIEELWRKYESGKPSKTYDEIRKSNREGVFSSGNPPQNTERSYSSNDIYADRSSQPTQTPFLYGSPSESRPRSDDGYGTYSTQPSYSDDSSSFMSGTPSGPSASGGFERNRYN